jgi:uncharacterized protein YciI
MKKNFVLHFKPGPAWATGKTSREQRYWNEHAVFMDHLFEEDVVVMGGPYADYSAIMIIIKAVDEAEVVEIFKNDPFILKSILVLVSINEWQIFLDARNKQQAFP